MIELVFSIQLTTLALGFLYMFFQARKWLEKYSDLRQKLLDADFELYQKLLGDKTTCQK